MSTWFGEPYPGYFTKVGLRTTAGGGGGYHPCPCLRFGFLEETTIGPTIKERVFPITSSAATDSAGMTYYQKEESPDCG